MDPEFGKELERQRSYLLRVARLQLRDGALAEDVVQDTLAAALTAREGFSGKSTLKTWLTGILKHKIVDAIRRKQREPVAASTLDEEADIEDGPTTVGSEVLTSFLREWRTQVEGAAMGVIWRSIEELGATDLATLADRCRQAALSLGALDPDQRLDLDDQLRVVHSNSGGPTAYQVVAVLEAIVILINGGWPPEPEAEHIHYVGYPNEVNRRLSRYRA